MAVAEPTEVSRRRELWPGQTLGCRECREIACERFLGCVCYLRYAEFSVAEEIRDSSCMTSMTDARARSTVPDCTSGGECGIEVRSEPARCGIRVGARARFSGDQTDSSAPVHDLYEDLVYV